MSEQGLTDFVVVPRYIARAYRDGHLSRAERDVYLWLRINANPYGIVAMSLETIATEVLGSSDRRNYANIIMLSLKSKRLLFYKRRTGRRGAFEVRFGDWILPRRDSLSKNNITNLDAYFENELNQSKKATQRVMPSEDYVEVASGIQNSDNQDGQSQQYDSDGSEDAQFSGSYTNTDNEIRTFAFGKQGMSLEEFEPCNEEENICLEIAQALGENDMRFILAALRKSGMEAIEKAFFKVQKEMARGRAENPRKLFNYLIHHPDSL